jgi:hypothetical protein
VLAFGREGLTVVYGDNASGKSGFARLIKAIVRARHQEPVLTNIFSDKGKEAPEAIVVLEENGEVREEHWPGMGTTALARVGFYDEACGDAYITTESEVTYRPSVLLLFDGLIRACDGVRAALDDLLTLNTAARSQLPDVPLGSQSGQFIAGLSGRATAEEVDRACSLPGDAAAQLAALVQEEARLRATDPNQERREVYASAARFETLADHLDELDRHFGTAAEQRLGAARDHARDRRTAADLAASTFFKSDPLPGVGSQAWRALWEAASRFSAEAYSGHTFPVVEAGARCVLCQQELDIEGADRLARFRQFMVDQTEQLAQAAEQAHRQLMTASSSIVVNPPDVAVNLEALDKSADALVAGCRQALGVWDPRRAALLRWADNREPRPIDIDPPQNPKEGLRSKARQLRNRAATIDPSTFAQMLSDVAGRRAELTGRMAIAGAREAVMKEVGRRRERSELEEAKKLTDTTGITKKATELVRAHVTAVVRDRFTRESDRLRLEKITLADTGGHKGQLFHQPAFLGATQVAEMRSVLSEGEQTALGLAGYLTEAYFDDSRSSMVLDDPVSSLDHIRRARVAQRLAEFAKDRQVIVLTHEITFVGDLRKAAEVEDVDFTERSIVRHGDGSPGLCLDHYPWKAKNVRERFQELDTLLARIKRERPAWPQEEYEKETAEWAGKLSETWERIINMEIVNEVVDRGTSEVRPKMFRLLVRITEEDDREFQTSYSRCSLWARRHDKSPEINYVPPEISDMTNELSLVRAWFDRIRKYAR